MKTRVVFNRPARAESYRCGSICVESRSRMLEVRASFTELRKAGKGEIRVGRYGAEQYSGRSSSSE